MAVGNWDYTVFCKYDYNLRKLKKEKGNDHKQQRTSLSTDKNNLEKVKVKGTISYFSLQTHLLVYESKDVPFTLCTSRG